MNRYVKKIPGGRLTVTVAVIVIIILALVWGFDCLFSAMARESTDDAFIQGHIVSVSAKVDGHVTKVYIKDNQWVEKGDLSVEVDQRDFQVSLNVANAALSAAKAAETQSRPRRGSCPVRGSGAP